MKLNKLMIVFLVIGILSSSLVAFKRMGIEADYKNYEVDFYYDELEKMAEQDEKSIDEMLRLMKNTGVRNVLVREETIQSMKQSPKYDVETRLDGYDMIVMSKDEELIKYIYNAYNDVKKDDREVVIEDKNTLRVEGKSYEQIMAPVNTINNYGQRGASTPVWEGSVLETVGLGYDQEAINKAKEHGYGVVLIPYFNPDFQNSEKSIEKFFATIDNNEIEPSHIYFSGNYVLGFDPLYLMKSEEETGNGINPLEILANGLEDRNIAVGFIESSSQGSYLETEGLKPLARHMEYEASGAYLTWDFIQTKYDFKVPGHHKGEEITNIFFRGITTRNIRLINLKPFIVDNRYLTDPEAYKNVLDNLEKRLSVHNVKPGRLQTLEFFEVSNIYRFFTALGIIAASIIIVDNLFDISKKWLYSLFALATILTEAVYFALGGLQNIFDKIFALQGAIVAPVLAIFIIFAFVKERYKEEVISSPKAFLYSVAGLLFLTAVCIISVLFEIAMLANNRYFLGLDAFSGVKIAQMVPILMVGVIYIAHYGYKRAHKEDEVTIKADDLKRFFTDDIKIWQVALLGIAIGALLILLRRSGNTNGTPSMVEVLLRNVLEFTFPARPRTKAIFLGMPALILLTYNAYKGQLRKFVLPLTFIGSIALVNTVNTYSHMKAPIYLSTYRTLAEIIVSTIIGFIIIIAQELILKIVKNKKGNNNA